MWIDGDNSASTSESISDCLTDYKNMERKIIADRSGIPICASSTKAPELVPIPAKRHFDKYTELDENKK